MKDYPGFSSFSCIAEDEIFLSNLATLRDTMFNKGNGYIRFFTRVYKYRDMSIIWG